MPTKVSTGRRQFGSVDRLPSGRWRARYTGADGAKYSARSKDGQSLTFETKKDALTYLATVQADIVRGAWLVPVPAEPTPAVAVQIFAGYADLWLRERTLQVRTREQYVQLLRDHIRPTFGQLELREITPATVRSWYTMLSIGPTAKAQAYGLLRNILNTAFSDELISANPCRIRGAGQVKRAAKIRPATLEELDAVVTALPEQYRLMAVLGAWCALRFGEIAELRRSDFDLTAGTVTISRGMVRSREQGKIVKSPKTEAGTRVVNIPPHVVPVVREHLASRVTGRNGLLFATVDDPTVHLTHSTFNKAWLIARKKAGRPDLRFHDLRHTGAVMAAVAGATLAELMARLGHSSPAAAMRYQHAAADRDRSIAQALSALAGAQVVS